MLAESINGNKWVKDIMKKLTSFADKCPLLLSITTGNCKGCQGVYIDCHQSNRKYFFKLLYDQDQKEFIHNIKTKILPEYPRIIQFTYEEHQASAMEIAEQLEKGADISNVNHTIKNFTGSKLWRIDKVLPWRQVFILELESIFNSEGQLLKIDKPEQRKYQY